MSIRGPQTNEVVPIGAQGEICARGYVMLGYNEYPEATAAAVDAEGWLHTSDLGTMDARGYLTITGRVKEMIIRGGENLFPAEIENAMLEHEAIAECAVVGIPDDTWGEVVACFMRATDTDRPADADRKAFIRARLAPHKTPHNARRRAAISLHRARYVRTIDDAARISEQARTPVPEVPIGATS